MVFNIVAAYFAINLIGAIKYCYGFWKVNRDEINETIDNSNHSNSNSYRRGFKLTITAVLLVFGILAYAPFKILTTK